jgi:chromosome partitioning protein
MDRLAIIDTDPQATAGAWASWRGADPDVIDCASHALGEKFQQAATLGAELAVIDTIMAREACEAADLVLIPCRPRAFDIEAVRASAELASASGKPSFLIFTAGPRRVCGQ